MNLTTHYLGFCLPHPLIIGSGPLTNELGLVRALEDGGAAAIVLRSLYEEEIVSEQMSGFLNSEAFRESFAEARSYLPDPELAYGPEEYLEHLRRVKDAVNIPVIAALNGVTPNGWTHYARLMEQAGADAIELNMYHAASDPNKSGRRVERDMIEILRAVRHHVSMPIAVKLPPFFTAFGHFAAQLDAAKAGGLVMFTRMHKVDIDIENLEIVRTNELSDSSELPLRLRGVAALTGRVKASLAVCGGVHTALDVVKATMVGAHATQFVSALLKNGPGYLNIVRAELEEWMEKNEWESLEDMRGNMCFDLVERPADYERGFYRIMNHAGPAR